MNWFYTLLLATLNGMNNASTTATNEVKPNRGQHTYTKHRQCVQSVVGA